MAAVTNGTIPNTIYADDTQPTNQKCKFCGADTIGSDVCSLCLNNPTRQEFFEKAKIYKCPKSYPTYLAFCDEVKEVQTADGPKEIGINFKPARVAEWLAENEHFKTDQRTDVLYYGDEEKGVWSQDGETKLQGICAIILGKENRVSHYNNILHHLKGLTFEAVIFSNKIACENGLLDVETGKFTPFTLDEMAFYSIATTYNPKAKCPLWLAFLKQVLAVEDIPTLQEWSGYLLLTDYRFHKLMWLHGDGRNGKGVYERTLEAILGEGSVSSVALEELDGNHRFAVRQLYGKLFNPCSEPTTNRILQTSLLKKATGQDTIDAECKGKDKRIKFRNYAKITVIANKFPKVRDSTTAFKERRLFVKFPREFTGKSCIANIEALWLNSPEEKSGILNWMLEGLQRLLKNGYFTESKSQEETEIAFERASDTISAFLKEMAIFDKTLETTRSVAYNEYKKYCETFGLDQESTKAFTQRLKETPKVSTATSSKPDRERTWVGIGFKKLNDDDSVADVARKEGVIPLSNLSNGKIEESINTQNSVTSATSRTCGQCELFHKPSCSFPAINFDKVPEDSNFALDCRSFTAKTAEVS